MCTSKCKTPWATPITGMEDTTAICTNCGDIGFFVTKEQVEEYPDLEIYNPRAISYGS